MLSIIQHLRRNLVAYLALFVALSSSSYAAASKLLPANSVGTRQVIDHSLLKKDFKAGQLPRGPEGPAGPAGPVSGWQIVKNAVIGSNIGRADCPTGKHVLGGGYDLRGSGSGGTAGVSQSSPNEEGTGWRVLFQNILVNPVYVYAVCAVTS
jgi:hypothetical protein